MTDVETTPQDGETAAAEVTPEDMISRGKGIKLDAVEDGSPAAAAVAEFKQLQERYAEIESQFEAVKGERQAAIYNLKANHNISFSAIGEMIGGTSSLVLYLYERAQGKSAKQIREESERSRQAKEQFRESDPNAKPARKQTPEEKAFRKQQREQLQAFLAEQKAAGADVEELAPEDDET
jgi:hypothetical protein